ncbi:hypothetical protein BSKO_06038 [Bryopsis sp. KO-2023]|nr:hypothetical protein BSKO_06038 [Bryopsis sp. KO-2023]
MTAASFTSTLHRIAQPPSSAVVHRGQSCDQLRSHQTTFAERAGAFVCGEGLVSQCLVGRRTGSKSRRYDIAAEPRVVERTALVEYAEGYSKKLSVEAGEVEIRLLQSSDIDAASVCLIRGFAGTPEEVPFSAARGHFASALKDVPDAILLIATINPKDKSKLPEGKTERLIGTVALSFTPETRAHFETLQPPGDAAYLFNMATDRDFRRQGIARGLLSACEEFCQFKGVEDLVLHVRLADIAAKELYKSSGFEEQARDLFLVEFKGVRPRALLTKTITPYD